MLIHKAGNNLSTVGQRYSLGIGECPERGLYLPRLGYEWRFTCALTASGHEQEVDCCAMLVIRLAVEKAGTCEERSHHSANRWKLLLPFAMFAGRTTSIQAIYTQRGVIGMLPCGQCIAFAVHSNDETRARHARGGRDVGPICEVSQANATP